MNYINVNYGVRSWLLTRDHKRIALLYLAAVTLFGIVRRTPGASLNVAFACSGW